MRISDWSSDGCSSDLEIIGGSQPGDQHPDLVAPRDRVDHRAGIGRIELSGQAIARGLIVKPAVDAAQLAGGHQPLERLVDSDPRAEIEKIAGRPDRAGAVFLHALQYRGLDVDSVGHVRSVYTNFGQMQLRHVRSVHTDFGQMTSR